MSCACIFLNFCKFKKSVKKLLNIFPCKVNIQPKKLPNKKISYNGTKSLNLPHKKYQREINILRSPNRKNQKIYSNEINILNSPNKKCQNRKNLKKYKNEIKSLDFSREKKTPIISTNSVRRHSTIKTNLNEPYFFKFSKKHIELSKRNSLVL